jgi:hypothetical protein
MRQFEMRVVVMLTCEAIRCDTEWPTGAAANYTNSQISNKGILWITEWRGIGYKFSEAGGEEYCWDNEKCLCLRHYGCLTVDARSVLHVVTNWPRGNHPEGWIHNYIFWWISLLMIIWSNCLLHGFWQGAVFWHHRDKRMPRESGQCKGSLEKRSDRI